MPANLELVLIDQFKPQQIHVVGKTAVVFNGICESGPAEFTLNHDWTEVVIHFDQPECLFSLYFDLAFSEGQAVEIESSRYQEYQQFQALHSAKIFTTSGPHQIGVNRIDQQDSNQDTKKTSQTKDQTKDQTTTQTPIAIMAAGLKLRMRTTLPGSAKLNLGVWIYKSYFAEKIKALDQAGYLKQLSITNEKRQDKVFDTKNIESGEIVHEIQQVIKQEACKVGDLLFPKLEPRKVNLIDESLRDGITMYVHLMNRNENVIKNLPNWLTQKFNELILLDWSSKEPVADIPNIFNDSRVRVVRVEGQEKFMRTLAQNLATQMARFKHVFKIDSDVSFKGNFFAKHPLKQGEFWVGDWHQGRDFNERHLHGETYYHIDDFFRVNGYDERILAYGHDDTNLKDRMLLAGLTKKVFSYNQIHHQEHPQESRATNQDMVHPMVKTYENRILAGTREIWQGKQELNKYTRVVREQLAEQVNKEGNKDSNQEKNKQSSSNYILFTANEKKITEPNAKIEEEAINIVASWYENQAELNKKSKEEKIKLIWEKQVE
jgi:hypothetical protein